MNSKQRDDLLFNRISIAYLIMYSLQFGGLFIMVHVFGDVFFFWPTELALYIVAFNRAHERFKWAKKQMDQDDQLP